MNLKIGVDKIIADKIIIVRRKKIINSVDDIKFFIYKKRYKLGKRNEFLTVETI
jgi:hypothetical protein